MKQALTVLTLLSLLSFGSLASAQDDRDNGSNTPLPLPGVRPDFQRKVEMRRATSTDRKIEIRTNLDVRRASSTERKTEAKIELETRRASSTERRLQIKAEFEARQASSTFRRLEMRKELAERKVTFVGKVLLATIERLEKILTRVESRIAKVKAEGLDTAESESFTAVARENLLEARTELEVFSSITFSSGEVNENFEKIREAAALVKEHLREARENLVSAVKSLKAVHEEEEDHDD